MKRLLILPLLSLAVFGQATMTQTTLSKSVAVNDTVIYLASTAGMSAASVSKSATLLLIDSEAMQVGGTKGAGIVVFRGFNTAQTAHLSGTTVWVGSPELFGQTDPSGACVSANQRVLPLVVISTGHVWDCTASQWTVRGGGGGGMTSAAGTPAGACTVGSLQADTSGHLAYWCDGTAWQLFLSGDPAVAGSVVVARGSSGTPKLGIQGSTSGEIDFVVPAAAGTNSTVKLFNGGVTPIPPGSTCASSGKVVQDIDPTTGAVTCVTGGAGGSIPVPTPGTTISLSAPNGDAVCTGTCTVSLPVPVAGYNFCVYNDDAVTAAITINNPGTGVRLGQADRSGYGTVTVGTLVSTAGVNSWICLLARDATHYTVTSKVGTWTNTDPIVYSGPGDVISGATAWYGLRAYSLATTTHVAANICNAADANCADVSTLANGKFDVATATGAPLNCGGAGGTCTVKILYDQTAGGLCTGSCDVRAIGISQRPTLTLNCIGSQPCMTFNSATPNFLNSANVLASAISQPFSVSGVAKRTGNFSGYNDIFGSAGIGQVGFNNSADNIFMYAGAAPSVAAPDNVTYSIQAMFNGASSILSLDGTPSTVNAGAGPLNDVLCTGACSNALTGRIFEIGLWPSNISSSFAAISTQQHSFWGF